MLKRKPIWAETRFKKIFIFIFKRAHQSIDLSIDNLQKKVPFLLTKCGVVFACQLASPWNKDRELGVAQLRRLFQVPRGEKEEKLGRSGTSRKSLSEKSGSTLTKSRHRRRYFWRQRSHPGRLFQVERSTSSKEDQSDAFNLRQAFLDLLGLCKSAGSKLCASFGLESCNGIDEEQLGTLGTSMNELEKIAICNS